MNFSKLFGKKGGDKKPANQDKNQATQLMLDQKIKEQELRLTNIETKTNALQEEAKAKLKAGDKAGAKRILTKKKKLVEQMKQIEGAMAMMEEQKMMLDSAITMKDVMGTIKTAGNAVKEATKGMSVDDLENMREEMEEMKAGQEELNDFFKDYADQDQEGVDDELEQLQEEMAKEEVGAMPNINTENLGPVPAEKNKEEEDLSNFLAV